ncbi:Uncharacterised protein [Vibrio cholerae]|nr:Uncharacterised protein [Vibrio cholerae]
MQWRKAIPCRSLSLPFCLVWQSVLLANPESALLRCSMISMK